MKHDESNLVMDSMDKYFDRMIELFPDEKDLWETRRQKSKTVWNILLLLDV